MDAERSSPLQWPDGWARTKQRHHAKFNYETRRTVGSGPDTRTIKTKQWITVAVALSRLQKELDRLGARYPVVSTNLELRLDGLPRSGQPEPRDTGAACYFTLKDKRTVLACDKWSTVADNIAAIAAHVYAIRAVERYGVGTLEQAFRGYQALPAPNGRPWWVVLGFEQQPSRDDAEQAYRRLMMQHHPDLGGNPDQAAELNAAIAAARQGA